MGKELHNKELIEDNVRLNQELLKAELRIAELEKIANLHVVPNESEEDYYVILDSETRFVHISKIDYGFKLSDFLGKKFNEIFPKELTDIFLENFEQSKLNGKSSIYFSTFQSPNGIVTQRNQIRELIINDEKFYQIRAENVTNSYERLKEVQEKEDLTNLALESTHTGTWSFNKLSMLFLISKTIRNIFEHNSDILDIPTFFRYIHPDDRERVTQLVQKGLAGINVSTEISYKILLPSGKLKYLTTTFKGVPNDTDEVINFYGITQDETEKVLKNQTEIQYQSLIQSINTNLKAGLYRSTPDKGFIFCNKAMWEMFGYDSFEEISKVPVANLYKDVETRDVSIPELTKRYNNREIYSSKEFEYKRKDGTTFFALVNSVLQRDDDGNFYFDGALHDITDMKYIQKDLENQQERFKAILDTTENTYVLLNKEGIVISFNKRMYEETLAFFNIKIKNGVTHYKEFVIPDRISEFENHYAKALNGENVYVVRKIEMPDASFLWYSFNFKPAYDTNDEIYAVSMSTLNVTNLKENETKLEKSLIEIQALFNAIPDTILKLNAEGDILDFKAGSKFEKFNPKNIIGSKLDKLNLTQHITSDLLKSVSFALSNKLVELIEFSLVDEYGDSNYFEARIVANADTTVIALVRDITDRKKFEYRMKALNSELEMKILERTSKLGEAIVDLSTEIDRRIAAQKEAENARELLQLSLENEKELNEMKTKFVAMVSHEYRTPLTIIQTSAFLLEKYYTKQNDQRFFTNLDKVHKSVASMVDMLENVLSYSKLESGNIQRRLNKSSVKEICENILSQHQNTSNKELYKFILQIDSYDFTIITDQHLLNQILNNLVFNAIKYSPDGGLIELIVTEGEKSVAFSVKDSGIGIAPEDIDKLVKPFQRGGNVKNIAGTGLGLSIVQAWTDILEGEIKIESKLGKGTIFTVILPRTYRNA